MIYDVTDELSLNLAKQITTTGGSANKVGVFNGFIFAGKFGSGIDIYDEQGNKTNNSFSCAKPINFKVDNNSNLIYTCNNALCLIAQEYFQANCTNLTESINSFLVTTKNELLIFSNGLKVY
jgi:hypothetical protein